jgi:hypothetical protein
MALLGELLRGWQLEYTSHEQREVRSEFSGAFGRAGGWLVLAVGAVITEARNGWPIFSPNRGKGFPTTMALLRMVFAPETMRYVAAVELKKGHELEPTDLTVGAKFPQYLIGFLPPKSVFVGKYLLRDTKAGEAIVPQDISADPMLADREGYYIFHLRVRTQPSLIRRLESTVHL